MIKNISRWSLLALLLVVGLMAASRIQAQDSTVTADTIIAAAAPQQAPVEEEAAVAAQGTCATEATTTAADPTPTLTGQDRSRTFNQALQVSGLSLATILAVMAIFGGLTAMLTRFMPAEQE